MTTALFGSVAPYCCFRLSPVQLLRLPSSNLSSKNHESHPDGSSSQSGLRVFSPWRGLTHVHHSFPSICKQLGKKRKSRCMVAYASLFGVGAPEVLVIGVVALLVFGPKGLAEVARNLGKTLRAFQPTIRELQEVSREFRSTLEREIGLDEGTSASNSVYRPSSIFNENQYTTFDSNGKPTANSPLAATESSEEQLRAQITSEAVTSPPSQEASALDDSEINTQTPSLENAEDGSK